MTPLGAFAPVVLALSAVSAAASTPVLQWETKGFSNPESVVYDSGRQQFYVSNMATSGAGAQPGDGFISRLSSEGKMLERPWVQGLENPKGLAISKGHLFVGDDVFLTEIDIASGRIVGQFKPADGAGDFNDCTAAPNGDVFVCSGRLHTVFRLRDGHFESWVVLDPADTGGINGLLAEKDRLLLGGWSLRLPDGREEVGHLSTIAYVDKAVRRIGSKPICHIDGLEPDGLGGYTVCDWLTGEVFHVSSSGEPTIILKLVQGSADHAYRADTHQLIIPLMKDNLVRAYSWTPDGP